MIDIAKISHDPTGCNTDPVYGLQSAHPTISVYRRPRIVGNLKYVLGSPDIFHPGVGNTGSLAADGRDASLEQQAIDAAHAHEQSRSPLTKAQLQQILDSGRFTVSDANANLRAPISPIPTSIAHTSRYRRRD